MASVSSKRSEAARRKRSQKKKAKARENARQSSYPKHQPCDPDVYDDYVDIAEDESDWDVEDCVDIDHDDRRVDSDPEVYDDCNDIDHDDRRVDSDPKVYDDCLAIDCEMICVRDGMALASVALVNCKHEVVYDKILRPPPAHLINWRSRRWCPITPQEFDHACHTPGTTFDEVREEVLKRLKR